jgi:hypothetical protein
MDRLRYLLGLLTLLAAIGGGVFLWNLLHEADRGTTFPVRVEFRNVRGLKAGADVRHRGVAVGVVHRVELRADTRRVEVVVALEPAHARLACANSQFWIVTPRFTGLGGATGLDTLVRDAYVSFITPDPAGPPLAAGATLIGNEKPALDEAEGVLEPVKHGDLLLTLLVGENHALAPGAPVTFRGLTVGEVRSIRLAPKGTHVEIVLRIDRSHRATATDQSKFWIARPRLYGDVIRGLNVEDIGAALTPYVGYWTPLAKGVPLPEGARVRASDERPKEEFDVPADALRAGGQPSRPTTRDSTLRVARVVYDAVERDALSANDPVHREGTGVVFADGLGRLAVLCTRGTVDGAWFVSDGWSGDPEIEQERISVTLLEGPVLAATRAWIDPEHDLALLVLTDPPAGIATTPTSQLAFDARPGDAGAQLVTAVVRQDGLALETVPAAEAKGAAEALRGAALVDGGQLLALRGQRGGFDEQPALVPIARLPEALRPRP